MADKMEIMLNDIKTTSIDTFQKIFESNIESSMKKSFSEIENKIKEDITTNIMKQIRGDDTYNYSLIPEVKIDIYRHGVETGGDIYKSYCKKLENKVQFLLNMKTNEKIVWASCSWRIYNSVILTNNGKLF